MSATEARDRQEEGLDGGRKVLTGRELKNLPRRKKKQISTFVSQALAKHTGTMLQYTPRQVRRIMNEERAVVVMDAAENEFFAFAQISPWDGNRRGQVVGTEFRSWLSNKKGAGVQALRAAAALNPVRFPGVNMYAVIESGNTQAQQKTIDVGGVEVPMPSFIKIELQAGAASVKTFNLAGVKPIAT